MHTKRKIVKSCRRLWAERVAGRILGAYYWGVEEDACCYGVAGETKDVQEWEVWEKALSCATLVVEEGLGVEGGGPGEEVGPAADAWVMLEGCFRR
jgi:hypothetical protein